MNTKGFTLVELMIVISIIGIMMSMAYAPYSYFQKKAEIKIAAKEISKTLNESRNLSIHGTSSGGINQSIGVYFNKANKNIIKIFSYNYDDRNTKFLLKEIKIQPNVWIEKVAGSDKGLFFYEAITGSGSFYKDDTFSTSITNNKISIDFSYKGTTSEALKKNIEYYTKTYISDY